MNRNKRAKAAIRVMVAKNIGHLQAMTELLTELQKYNATAIRTIKQSIEAEEIEEEQILIEIDTLIVTIEHLNATIRKGWEAKVI